MGHSEVVNGVSIGRKSGRVLASASDDRTVKIWTIGQPSPVMVCTGK